MKKVLSFILIILCAVILTVGILAFNRYQKNTEQIFPYPYAFAPGMPALSVDAPILIVGDRMGNYFARFQTNLSETISRNLAKPIRIQSIAKDGYGIHRTLHQLKNLATSPQIIIYQGGSEEFSEITFNADEIHKINVNFRRFADDRLETAMILYPVLSRIIYEPIRKIPLAPEPQLVQLSEEDYLKRLETTLLLYQQQLKQIVDLAKDHNSLLILTTTPVNLDAEPRRPCDFTSTMEVEKDIDAIQGLIKEENYKTAYARSSRAVKQYAGNARLYYLHGLIARRLGNIQEATNSLLESGAYDCEAWRATEVQNTIIRRVAKDNQVMLFDFARMVNADWPQNPIFFDDIYPQNLYYERGMQQLGLVIKTILKL